MGVSGVFNERQELSLVFFVRIAPMERQRVVARVLDMFSKMELEKRERERAWIHEFRVEPFTLSHHVKIERKLDQPCFGGGQWQQTCDAALRGVNSSRVFPSGKLSRFG
jgi:hypothetical protein